MQKEEKGKRELQKQKLRLENIQEAEVNSVKWCYDTDANQPLD